MDYDRIRTQLWSGVLNVADACLLPTDAPDDTKDCLARLAYEIIPEAQKWHKGHSGGFKGWLKNLKATPIVDAPCLHAPEDPEKILKGVYQILRAHLNRAPTWVLAGGPGGDGRGDGNWEGDWKADIGLSPMESLQLFGLCNERPNLEKIYTFCQVFAGIDRRGLNDVIHRFCPTLLQIHVETPVGRKRRLIKTNAPASAEHSRAKKGRNGLEWVWNA